MLTQCEVKVWIFINKSTAWPQLWHTPVFTLCIILRMCHSESSTTYLFRGTNKLRMYLRLDISRAVIVLSAHWLLLNSSYSTANFNTWREEITKHLVYFFYYTFAYSKCFDSDCWIQGKNSRLNSWVKLQNTIGYLKYELHT